MLHTWLNLCALTWGRQETPPLSIHQVCELTGKKQSAIFGHMTALRNRDALRWRHAQSGTFIVAFPDFAVDSRNPESLSRNLESDSINPESSSKNLESCSKNLEKPSLNDSLNTHMDTEKEVKRGPEFQRTGIPLQKTGIPDNETPDTSISPRTLHVALVNLTPDTGKLDTESTTDIYSSITGLSPNKTQRLLIEDKITDTNI